MQVTLLLVFSASLRAVKNAFSENEEKSIGTMIRFMAIGV
jgi:hypothetical protein